MEDINQLELTAYIIVVSREISNYNDKTIDNYIDLLEDEMLKTSKRAILTTVITAVMYYLCSFINSGSQYVDFGAKLLACITIPNFVM